MVLDELAATHRALARIAGAPRTTRALQLQLRMIITMIITH